MQTWSQRGGGFSSTLKCVVKVTFLRSKILRSSNKKKHSRNCISRSKSSVSSFFLLINVLLRFYYFYPKYSTHRARIRDITSPPQFHPSISYKIHYISLNSIVKIISSSKHTHTSFSLKDKRTLLVETAYFSLL